MISSHNEFDKELLPNCLVDVVAFALMHVKAFLSFDKNCCYCYQLTESSVAMD